MVSHCFVYCYDYKPRSFQSLDIIVSEYCSCIKTCEWCEGAYGPSITFLDITNMPQVAFSLRRSFQILRISVKRCNGKSVIFSISDVIKVILISTIICFSDQYLSKSRKGQLSFTIL